MGHPLNDASRFSSLIIQLSCPSRASVIVRTIVAIRIVRDVTEERMYCGNVDYQRITTIEMALWCVRIEYCIFLVVLCFLSFLPSFPIPLLNPFIPDNIKWTGTTNGRNLTSVLKSDLFLNHYGRIWRH